MKKYKTAHKSTPCYLSEATNEWLEQMPLVTLSLLMLFITGHSANMDLQYLTSCLFPRRNGLHTQTGARSTRLSLTA